MSAINWLRNRLLRIVFAARRVKRGGHVSAEFRWPRIRNRGSMQVGNRFRVRAPVYRVQLETSKMARLVIGDDVFINEGVVIAAVESICIGDYVKIGDHVTIHDSDYHAVDEASETRVAAVSIQRNVWIGRNCVILPGVVIGENSVVAAGSIVTASVDANTVVGGNPARVLRTGLQCSPDYVRS